VPDGTSSAIRDKAAELFDREARTLMKLDHPNIVHVLDHFVEQGRNYMMLEYANGQDLRQHVKQNGAARPESVIEWMIQITGILKYLHEQDPPIIHRDVTPDNLVLRKDGNIMMIDFGAANEFLGTATGTFVGKQAYISPEQFRGKAVVQSDIYSFGGTVHFLLTGEDPLALSTSNPQKINPNVPVELDEIVASCTQLEVSDRYQSAAQLLPVLKRLSAVQV
jgi:serine/threonine-protein kinase